MTVAQQIARVSSAIAQREATGKFRELATMLVRYKDPFTASKMAEKERCTPRVANILKTAVTGGNMTDWSAISDYQNIVTAFMESLRTLSVFDAALADGMIRAPLRSRGFSVTTGITGSVMSEGSVKPISSLVLGQQLLEPKKASAILVVSKETANSPGATAILNSELTKGVVAATDNVFLAALIAATTPTGSAGSSLVQITTDFDVLLS